MTEYVRARMPRKGTHDLATTTSALSAAAEGWDVLKGEPTHDRSGAILPDTRLDGRPSKPKTSVDKAAAEKAATSASKNTDNPPSNKE